MRSIVFAASALLASTAIAFAGEEVMASYYGNTLISKGGAVEIHSHYKADHTMTATLISPMGSMDMKGTWKFDDKGQLCRNYDNPPPGFPNPFCSPIEAHKVGDTWTMTTANGTRTLSLVAGEQ